MRGKFLSMLRLSKLKKHALDDFIVGKILTGKYNTLYFAGGAEKIKCSGG